MTIDTTVVPYGSKAMEVLAAQVASFKWQDRLTPVTVVVPSNYAAVAARRALAARPGGVVNVSFLTLRRLAQQIDGGRLAATGRRPVASPVIAAALRAVLHQEPGVFAPVADHPSTEEALASAYRELRAIPDVALDALAKCSSRASDVVRICRSTHARLAGDWYDEEDLLSAVVDGLAGTDGGAIGPVVVHLLSDITSRESELVWALSRVGQVLVNIGLTGDSDADAAVNLAYQRAGIGVPDPETMSPPCATRIVSASDPDDEVRAAVRLIVEWMGQGVRLGRVAIVYANPDPYARLLHEHLAAAGIPFNGTPVRAIGEMLLGRALRSILALPDRGFRRSDVLGVLSDAPVLDENEHIPIRAWERLSRLAGVVSGEDWTRRLAVFANAERGRAEVEDEEGLELRASQRRHDADRADSLASFVTRLRMDLDQGAQAQSWLALVNWTAGLIRSYLGDEGHRTRWPEDEQECARRVEDALTRLAALDAIDGPAPNLNTFRRALEHELEAATPRIGTVGVGVLVGHVSIAPGLALDRLVMLGMSEGRFPPRRLEDSLLPDRERAVTDGSLRLRADRIHEDHHQLLAAMSGADQAVLCWPRGDLRQSTDRPASRWLLTDAARLSGVHGIRSAELIDQHSHEPWFDLIDSFAGGLARSRVLATEQELRLAAIARGHTNHSALQEDPVLRSALVAVRARASDSFTRFDGNLSSVAAEIRQPSAVSATQLQTWATCPRNYFFGYILGVEPVQEPERRLSIDALDRGALIHSILEDFVRESIDSDHTLKQWSMHDRHRLHTIAESHFHNLQKQGRTGREVLWHRERSRILTELNMVLDEDNVRLAEGLRPVAVEQRFDRVELVLGCGEIVELRGYIDRIDQRDDGSLEIIDYKTGNYAAYSTISELAPHDGGKHLQLYVYALAGRKTFPEAPSIRALFWFTKANKFIGYPVTAEVEEQVFSAVESIVEGIAAGMFPAHPANKPAYGYVDCWSCTPDGLSDANVRREWERKRVDPALAKYVSLTEPGQLQ